MSPRRIRSPHRRRPAPASAPSDRLCARHLQGLHDARRRRPVPDRAAQRGRQDAGRTRQGVRRRHRPAAALRLVRCGAGAPDRPHQRHRRPRFDQARHSRRLPRDQGLRRLSSRRPRDRLPSGGEHAQARVEPVYETIAGWGEKTARARSWGELPAQAIKYVRRIEELVGAPPPCSRPARNAKTPS